MSDAQWRHLNSLLVMQKIVHAATTVISSAYPGKCHWLNMAPAHAVCRPMHQIWTSGEASSHQCCRRVSLCWFQKFLQPNSTVSNCLHHSVLISIPRCMLTWSIHHSPKLSSVAISAAVTLSSRLSPHSIQAWRAGMPPSDCFNVFTGIVSCKSGPRSKEPALI